MQNNGPRPSKRATKRIDSFAQSWSPGSGQKCAAFSRYALSLNVECLPASECVPAPALLLACKLSTMFDYVSLLTDLIMKDF